MKPMSYSLLLIGTLIVGCVSVVGIRLAAYGDEAFWKIIAGAASHSSDTAPGSNKDDSQPGKQLNADDPKPILPARIAAVPGQKLQLYYDGLIIAQDPENYVVEISSPTLHGTSERRLWWVEPTYLDVGTHEIAVRVSSLADGKLLAEGRTIIDVVKPPNLQKSLNILIVGASNIHQAILPNDLWTRLNKWSPGLIRFIGSDPIKEDFPFFRSALPNVRFEGVGGWAWAQFVGHYMPGQEALYKLSKSPFVFLENGQPTLDVGRYLDESEVRGDLGSVMFDLGINETFGANPDDPENLNASIDSALTSADRLIAAFRESAPEAKLVIGIPAPFTRSEPVFMKRYGSDSLKFGDPWRHRRIVLALAKRMIEHFDQRDPMISLAPLYLTVDTIDGYWQVDPGHPNEIGADQMAATYEAALFEALDPRPR